MGSRLPTFGRGDATLIFVPEKAAFSSSSATAAAAEAEEEPRLDADKDYAGMTLRLRQGTRGGGGGVVAEYDCLRPHYRRIYLFRLPYGIL